METESRFKERKTERRKSNQCLEKRIQRQGQGRTGENKTEGTIEKRVGETESGFREREKQIWEKVSKREIRERKRELRISSPNLGVGPIVGIVMSNNEPHRDNIS